MNSTYFWIHPLAHIRNWVATLYGLIVSLLGLWRFFTTSWLLQCTWWAHEWHVSTLTHRLWSKCLFSITMFFRDDNACTHEWSTDHFSECVERHAYSTYDEYLKLHEGKAGNDCWTCLRPRSFGLVLRVDLFQLIHVNTNKLINPDGIVLGQPI